VTEFVAGEKYPIKLDSNGKTVLVKGELLDTPESAAKKVEEEAAQKVVDDAAAIKAAEKLARDNETDEEKQIREIADMQALRKRADEKRKSMGGDDKVDIDKWRKQGKIESRRSDK
jgi:hypothetical protein